MEDEIEEHKVKIKGVVDENLFTPNITIIRKTLLKKYSYYYGRITFSENRKDVQIPKKVVEKEIKILEGRNNDRIFNGKEPIYNTDIEKEVELKVRLKGWVLEWWMDEGILKKK